MAKALKIQNTPRLLLVVAVNVLFFLVVVLGKEFLQSEVLRLSTEILDLLPFGVGLAFIGVINAVIGPHTKARIVFMRWQYPLPGSEAFTRYVHEDHRVDLEELNKRYGPLPDDPSRQNKLWYKIYKKFEDKPSVLQAHREYLFTRDYTALALYMLVCFGGAGFLILDEYIIAGGYFFFLGLQFTIAAKAARINGKSFVTNVLALASSEKRGTNG